MSEIMVRNRRSESGNIIFYIFAAFGLMAFLVFTMTQGTNESVVAAEAQKMTSLVKADIQTIHNAIQECILMHPDPIDNDGDGDIDFQDNPNPPFPLYLPTPHSPSEPMDSGLPKIQIKNIVCPGEFPTNGKKIFNGESGRFLSIVNSPDFTTTYMTDYNAGAPFVVVEIRHNTVSTIWVEVMARLQSQLDPSSTGSVTIDMVTGYCGTSGGCLQYFLVIN